MKMADTPKPEDKKSPVFDLEDASLETTYVNTTHAIVGEGDITLYFGFQPIAGNDFTAFNVKRMAMTHDSFMRMMEYWATRYRFLETLYGGKPITLRDADRDAVASAFDTMYGRSGEEADRNETSDVSRDKAQPFSPADEK